VSHVGAFVSTMDSLNYDAKITGASLRLRDTKIIADLLIKQVSDQEWNTEIFDNNVLQMTKVTSIQRISPLLRARIEPLGEGLWKMVRDGDRVLSTQAAFAGAVNHSRLLGDFMDLVIREQIKTFAKKIEARLWIDYIEGCRGRDPELPHWSDQTVAKLRSVVFTMLAEADYLSDTNSMLLQNVFVDEHLSAYLRDRGEGYVLRCLEVTG